MEFGDNIETPNSDEGIFQSTYMYFDLGPNEYLDVIADGAIFRRLVKQKEIWPKLQVATYSWPVAHIQGYVWSFNHIILKLRII